ncbi:MAG: multifunctional CCA tRNA nucleotidyl transferase/2'3'-cyclic phosphodiesterase/2'nucleotidase/phosphatase [Burkholderiaceae bacterium]
MQIYRVGGSVRDELLGLPVHDTDWVVVGATPEQMIDQGYQPVGKDFPVFLHPKSHEEYALARTERKTGPGYKGFAVHFAPDVTLEEDLARRDITINAMAADANGAIIDPFNGQQDLRERVFRHVSEAFAEDPVRILRVARFAARLPDFTIADETLRLMQSMATNGEVDALVPERVWQELSRGLMEKDPARLFAVLDEAKALVRLLPTLYGSGGSVDALTHLQSSLKRASEQSLSLPARFGILALAVTTRAQESNQPRNTDAANTASAANTGTQLASVLRAPNDCRDIAQLLVTHRSALFDTSCAPVGLKKPSASELLQWIQRFDGLRRPERLPHIMGAANAWSGGKHVAMAQWLETAVAAAAIDAGAIARPLAKQGPDVIARALEKARLEAIEKKLSNKL